MRLTGSWRCIAQFPLHKVWINQRKWTIKLLLSVPRAARPVHAEKDIDHFVSEILNGLNVVENIMRHN